MVVAVLLMLIIMSVLFLPVLTIKNVYPLKPKTRHHFQMQPHQPQATTKAQLFTQSIEFNQSSYQDFTVMCEQNEHLVDIYNELGQSIAALNIQLQVAQKLWQTNPNQAKESVNEAYHLSGSIMREVRETVRSLNRELNQVSK